MSPPAADVAEMAKLFAALGDPTRAALVYRLGGGQPLSIARLTADSHITRQAMTKHLRLLEEAGLVRGVKVGRENRFALVPRSIDRAGDWLNAVSAQWDDALARLAAFVEGGTA